MPPQSERSLLFTKQYVAFRTVKIRGSIVYLHAFKELNFHDFLFAFLEDSLSQ